MIKITEKISHASNWNKGINKKNRYIVIHFTANNGDAAAGNAAYFSSPNRKASAHYFVDENEIYKTVRCQDVAWHCGAKTYRHHDCRNNNSIGIELCSRRTAEGVYYFKEETIKNAVELIRVIMKAYGIPEANVIRHFDVTGKNCPAPFASAKLTNNECGTPVWQKTGTEAGDWEDFKNKLK